MSIVDDLCDSVHDLTEPVYLCEMPKPTLTERMEAVEAALGLRPKRNAADWTRDHWLALSISIGTVILVIIAYLAWWQPQWAAHEHENFESNVNKLIETKQEQPIKDIHQIQLDIAKITTRLDDLLQLAKPIAIRQLRAALSLPPKQFAENLPSIKAAIDAAINVKLPASDYASELRSKLHSVPATTPAYWQTVGSLVSFRSSDGSIASQFLPPCEHLSVAIIPGKTKVTQPSTGGETTITGPMTHTGCTLQLDGLKLIGHDFSKSVIIYRGGPVNLENVHFHDCLWDVAIPSEGVPVREGKTLLTHLLQSNNIEDISIPSVAGPANP